MAFDNLRKMILRKLDYECSIMHKNRGSNLNIINKSTSKSKKALTVANDICKITIWKSGDF